MVTATEVISAQSHLKVITTSTVQVSDARQRKEVKQSELDLLKRSIAGKGLLHPIVLTSAYVLVAGERRLRAIEQLHTENVPFECNGQPVPQFCVPYLAIADLSEADLQEAELEENLLRVPLPFLDECEAKALIHRLRQQTNPEQTYAETGEEIAEIRGTDPKTEAKSVAQSLIILEHRNDPRVQRAKSKREAFSAILDQAETIFQANLSRKEKGASQDHTVISGDCRKELPLLPSNSVATIICDPPYGIKADKQGKESNHYYNDDPKYALEICELVIREGFRIAKSRALMFMFCDIDHFVHLRQYAGQQAWTVWRTPLTWFKGDSGHAPWGRAGFRRTTEIILFASKGQAELRTFGGADLFDFPRVGRGARVHAAEKPVDLLKHLVSISTLAGETVLDPCAGSGSIIPACRSTSTRAICIERDPTSYAECLARCAAPRSEAETDYSAPADGEAEDDRSDWDDQIERESELDE